MVRTKDFGAVIRRRLASDPKLAESVDEAAFHAHIAGQIYNARVAARMTQKELAKRAGTTQSVIARLEDAEYYGHSNKLIRRVASALGLVARVELFAKAVSKKERAQITARFTGEVTISMNAPVDDAEYESIATVAKLPEEARMPKVLVFGNKLSQ